MAEKSKEKIETEFSVDTRNATMRIGRLDKLLQTSFKTRMSEAQKQGKLEKKALSDMGKELHLYREKARALKKEDNALEDLAKKEKALQSAIRGEVKNKSGGVSKFGPGDPRYVEQLETGDERICQGTGKI